MSTHAARSVHAHELAGGTNTRDVLCGVCPHLPVFWHSLCLVDPDQATHDAGCSSRRVVVSSGVCSSCRAVAAGNWQRHLLAIPAAPALSMVNSCLPLAPGFHTGVTLQICRTHHEHCCCAAVCCGTSRAARNLGRWPSGMWGNSLLYLFLSCAGRTWP